MGCLATLGLTASAGIALAQDDAEREAIAERLKPVGELCVQGEDCGTMAAASGGGSSASSGGGDDIDGAGIYNNVCMACHETGAAGAPIRGDEAAWADRVEQGFATLLDHSINGFNAMPARGGNPNLSDAEMEAVTAYMVEPVMDVPELGGGADEASAEDTAAAEDAAAAEETAAAEDAAAAEETAAADNADNADNAAGEDTGAAEDAAAADNAATEVAAADLPGADKIGTCVACHGQDGHGTAPMYPNLAGQNVAYMEGALKAYRDGQRQGGMSAIMTPMAASLSDEDITDIANYYHQQPR
ncbi:c-type cytochrome [Halomonas alimentaria]|uniref:C-type cytochrome n=2 Tax=Halomonas alimentaria TaxID=147248 RepID=A0A7X5AQY4_9GAMM|nr:c-type cytochrome [Halomonas alimentaria]NAW34596.1 c-type cytochrome [Halomonas alimentaria]